MLQLYVSDLQDLFTLAYLAKVVTESAIQQRLRRMCSKRKNGTIPAGEEAAKLFTDVSKRPQLARMLAEANFDKEMLIAVHELELHMLGFPVLCRWCALHAVSL